MDARRFDTLTRALSEAGTRRGLLGLLSTLPVLGGLFTLPKHDDEVDAKGRRKRRKKRHKHGKGRHKNKHQKKCKPHAKTRICQGKCGPVKNNCKKTVDCGSCDCDPACEACFTCQGAVGAPGACVPQEAGTPCGDATTCEDGALFPQGSCDGSGSCQAGTEVSCAPYLLCDGDACATTCGDDDDCVVGSFCNDDDHCVGDQNNGLPCDHGGQCASGFCVDGVCCNSACDGDCEACDLPDDVGSCLPEPNGTACGGGNLCCSGDCVECCDGDDCAETEPICVSGSCEACSVEPEACPGGTCCNSDSGACVESCPSPQTCGGGDPGTPGVCGCTPTTCAAQGKNCGTVSDGCGGFITCGSCTVAGESCGGGGVPNVCGNPQGTCAAGADKCTGTGTFAFCNGNSNCACVTTMENTTACVGPTSPTCGDCTSSAQCGSEQVCVKVTGGSCPCGLGQGFCAAICPPAA